jgi:outer membrane protein insertion porin family
LNRTRRLIQLAAVLALTAALCRTAAAQPGGSAVPEPPAAADSAASLPPLGVPPDTTAAAAAPILSVAARGFVSTDSMVIIRTFGLKAGDPYQPSAVSAGVRRLYGTGLFTDVSVEDVAQEGGVRLLVQVAERPRVKGVEFRGAKKIEGSTLKSKLTVADGQLLDEGTLRLDAQKIKDAYAEQGYAEAKVTSRTEPSGPGQVRVVFDIKEGPKLKVREIAFHGNEHIPSGALQKVMKSKTSGFLRSGTFKPGQLEQDETAIRLAMRSRGYKDAEVDSIRPLKLPEGKGVALHVWVREGPRYRFGSIAWSGNTTVSNDVLLAVTTTRTGDPYSESAVQKTLENAYQLYQEHGYLFLGIDPQFTDTDSLVDVVYEVHEGTRSRVADLRILGNTRTKENVIRREASIHPGDVFRRSTLVRTQRDIFALGYFQDVQVDYEPTGDSADINLKLKVIEKQTGTASAGAGYSSQTGVTGFIELGHNNLFGTGQRVNLHLERGSSTSNVQISYTDPWFHNTPTTLGFDIFNVQRNYDFYDRKDVGGGVRVGRPLGWPDYTRALVSYDLRDVTLSNFSAPQPGEPANLATLRTTDWPRRVSSLGITFSRVSTDNPFNPSRGSRITWDNVFAGGLLGGAERYYKESLENRSYSRLAGPFVLMLRQKAGFLGGPVVPDYERFRLGGTTSDYLRGYPDYYVVPRSNITKDPSTGRVIDRYPGGRAMLILTSEVQFPIANPLRGLLFFEGGNTWNGTQDLDLGDLRKSVGFGFRIEVPALGRIGLDFGYGFDREEGGRWQTHFQLGNTF